MKVCETFVSFQGEVNVGRFAFFIRLANCNLNCSFCFGMRKNKSKMPKIMFLDGKNKYLNEVKKGDILLTLDNNHKLVETKVINVIKRKVDKWLIININNHNYFVTPEHQFFTIKGLKAAYDLEVGDEIFNVAGSEKMSYRMTKNNPMFNDESMNKHLINTDWIEHGKAVSNTIKKKQKQGMYYSPWSILDENTKQRLRRLLSKKQKGKNNSNWKGNNKNFNLLKKLCSENRLNKCKSCCKDRRLEVHHIDFNKENDEMNNLTTICHSCHSKAHKRGYSFWKNNNRLDKKVITFDKLSIMNDFLSLKHNGAKVNSIKYFDRTDDSKYKYEYFKPKPLVVYNLSCKPYNSYIADGMWVHNCDTDYAKFEGVDLSVDELVKQASHFRRIVITGGEPLLQKYDISKFIEKVMKKNPKVIIEIETNGTIKPIGGRYLGDVIFNVSPKLKNSDNKYDKRIVHDTLNWFNEMDANFKFVIDGPDDIDEVNMLVNNFGISKRQVFLMPQGKTREEQLEKMDMVVKYAKVNGYNVSPRLHILIWDRKRGV